MQPLCSVWVPKHYRNWSHPPHLTASLLLHPVIAHANWPLDWTAGMRMGERSLSHKEKEAVLHGCKTCCTQEGSRPEFTVLGPALLTLVNTVKWKNSTHKQICQPDDTDWPAVTWSRPLPQGIRSHPPSFLHFRLEQYWQKQCTKEVSEMLTRTHKHTKHRIHIWNVARWSNVALDNK